MPSQSEKNLSTLYAQRKDDVVDLAFDNLISEDSEKKKQVRVDITSSEWFDGYGILTLAGRLFYDSRAGWGRAKRNAITAWYTRRPLELVKKQIDESPRDGSVRHEDVISFLHIPSMCVDEDRYYYFAEIIGEDMRSEQVKTDTQTKQKKTGFWSFVSELLGC